MSLKIAIPVKGDPDTNWYAELKPSSISDLHTILKDFSNPRMESEKFIEEFKLILAHQAQASLTSLPTDPPAGEANWRWKACLEKANWKNPENDLKHNEIHFYLLRILQGRIFENYTKILPVKATRPWFNFASSTEWLHRRLQRQTYQPLLSIFRISSWYGHFHALSIFLGRCLKPETKTWLANHPNAWTSAFGWTF